MIRDESTLMLKVFTPPRVFIDTNIWFSAFYGSTNPSQIISQHISSKINGVISQDVLKEIIKNIKLKLPHKLSVLENLMESTPPQIIKTPSMVDQAVKDFVDKKDQKIFQSAVDSKCDLFITGNLRDFNIKGLEKVYKIKILSPKEAAEILFEN